jgi:diguanylate cyclase (GGDEF)-like protein
MPVMTWDVTKETWGRENLIVLLAFGSSRPEVLENILRIHAEAELYVPDVPAFGDSLFDRAFFESHRKELEAARALLSDGESKRIFDGIVEYKLTGSLDAIEDANRATVDPAYQDLVRDFTNLERLKRELRDKDSDSVQYLAKEVGWMLGRAVVMERNADGVPTKLFYIVEDIDKSKRQMELVSYRAEHDALTGLLNRAALDHSMGDVRDDPRPVAVMIMDVDAFKSVNDHFGHGVGDQVLSGVARAISSSMRSSDLVYRYGGDEFVVIARNCPASSEPELVHRISLINRSLEGRFAEVPNLTLSAGIAFGANGSMCDELLASADTALYRAKRTPAKCCVFDPEVDKA